MGQCLEVPLQRALHIHRTWCCKGEGGKLQPVERTVLPEAVAWGICCSLPARGCRVVELDGTAWQKPLLAAGAVLAVHLILIPQAKAVLAVYSIRSRGSAHCKSTSLLEAKAVFTVDPILFLFNSVVKFLE